MARAFGRDYTIGGSGGGVVTATSNSLIGGGDVPLTRPNNTNVTVTVSISAPISGTIESAAALNGTVPQYGYTPSNISIGGFQIKFAGIGFGDYGDSAFNLNVDAKCRIGDGKIENCAKELE